jgi:hypothetical protein
LDVKSWNSKRLARLADAGHSPDVEAYKLPGHDDILNRSTTSSPA